MDELNSELKKGKNKKGLIICIVTLIVLLAGGFAYIYFKTDLINENNVTSNSNKSSNKKKAELKDDDIKDIDDNIKLDDQEQVNNETVADSSKYEELYNDLKVFTYYKSRENGISSFSSDDLANLYYYYGNSKKSDYYLISHEDEDVERYEFSDSLVANVMKKYFGSTALFNKNSIVNGTNSLTCDNYNDFEYNDDKYALGSCGITFKSYNDVKEEYTISTVAGCGCGGPTGPKAITRVIEKAIEKDDTIIITEKAIYVDYDYSEDNSSNLYVYSDPAKTNKIDTIKASYDDAKVINVKDYIDKASTITQVYKLDKSSNNYYFVSSKIN